LARWTNQAKCIKKQKPIWDRYFIDPRQLAPEPTQRLCRHDKALANTKKLQTAMGRSKDIETIHQLETILSERMESSSQKS
jgi:hypothetical protein